LLAVLSSPVPRKAIPLAPKPFELPSPVCAADSRICEESGRRGRGFVPGRFHAESNQSLRFCGRVKPIPSQCLSTSIHRGLSPRCRSLPMRHRMPLHHPLERDSCRTSGLPAFVLLCEFSRHHSLRTLNVAGPRLCPNRWCVVLFWRSLIDYWQMTRRLERGPGDEPSGSIVHLARTRPTTPATPIAPPATARAVIFSPSNTRAKGITTSGVIAMIASTMPVGVVSSAHCMQLTPSV